MARVINAGLAAYGMSGRVFHAPLLARHPGFHLARVVERTTDRARDRYPELPRTDSIDALLADETIELVVVNTPDATHFDLARRALEAGRHVVVEKPFTGRPDRASRLMELAARHGVLLTVFQNRRWDGDFMTVRQLLAGGTLGRLVEFESRWDRFRPVVTDSWKERASGASGALPNLGTHLIDQALVLFGAPAAVTAQLGAARDGAEVDDWFDLRLHYPRLEVTLKASTLALGAGPRFVLHGTGGSFVKHGLDPQEDELAAGAWPDRPDWGEDDPARWGTLTTAEGGGALTRRVRTAPGRYAAFYDGLHAAITTGTPPPVRAEESLHVLRIVEAARHSSAGHATISLEESP